MQILGNVCRNVAVLVHCETDAERRAPKNQAAPLLSISLAPLHMQDMSQVFRMV